jgi:serine/threonine-protein kinase HipA
MTLNGKTDEFTASDFRDCASVAGLERGRHTEILTEVVGAVKNWPRYADEAGVTTKQRDAIAHTLRLHFGQRRSRAKRAGKSGTHRAR